MAGKLDERSVVRAGSRVYAEVDWPMDCWLAGWLLDRSDLGLMKSDQSPRSLR